MVYTLVFNLVGLWIFLFLFWKKLKEDYLYTQIFTTAFYILIGLFAGYLIAGFFLPLWWFWFCLLGIILGFILGVVKFKLRLYEALEALVIAILPWLSLFYLIDSINSLSWFSLGQFVYILFLIMFYIFLGKHYKKFTWYKSGRVGFAGLTTLAVLFLTRAGIAIIFPFMLSFSGGFEPLISGVFSFIAFLVLFNLSRAQ